MKASFVNLLLRAQIRFWFLYTKPRQVIFSFLALLFLILPKKMIYLSAANSFSNSPIIFSHSHNNLVLKCLQCGILTKH